MSSIEKHKEVYGAVPRLVAADAGFFSAKNEQAAQTAGVAKVCIPSRNAGGQARRKHQKQRWFRRGQRWRVGCEGRISVVKRRHGLFRSRYKGEGGMERWVGLGIIANNLTVIGAALAIRRTKRQPAD
jgi:IS5 family transposase